MSSGLVDSGSFQYQLYDFLDDRGRSVIQEWVRREKITVRDRAALNIRFKRIRQVDFALAHKSLISGPIYKHVYKCVIHGDVMLRPMLCRGPLKIEEEYTLLLGAIERDRKLPKGSMEQAEQNRDTLIAYPTKRRPHEGIPQKAR